MPAYALLPLALVCSGAAGLMFQIVWFHRAALLLGSSVSAIAVVLSAFMAGLALGSWLAATLGRRVRQPMRAYACLECLIAAAGLVAAWLLGHLTGPIVVMAHLLGDAAWALTVARFAVAFVVLVVPTAAMGATLPIVVNAPALRRSGVGAVLGRLYGWNTIGALIGVLLAEFLVIEALGIGGAGWIAAALNGSAALIAWRLRGVADGAPAFDAAREPIRSARHTGTALLLACAALAGGVFLALEVVWFRFLSMFVLSTTMAGALMLAAILAGIAIGGLAGGRIVASRPGAHAFVALAACAAGLTIGLSYWQFDALTSGTQVGSPLRVLWFSLVLTWPTAFVSGVLFTLIGDGLHQRGDVHRTAIARLALANTIGAALGPPVAAFVLLPALGMERSLRAAMLAYGVVGILALVSARRHAPAKERGAAIAAVAGGVALSAAILLFPSGMMAGRYFARATSTYAADGSRIVATREGISQTLFVMQQQWRGQPVYSRLVTDGFSMSGTATPGLRYMRYFAYWPMLMHDGPVKNALLICYGVGVTAKALLEIPGLERLDVADVSSDIVAMSDVLYDAASHPLRDPRVALHIEDGRFLLAITDQRFDVITGEPPPPRTPGAVNIYDREFFDLVYQHLNEGGIATYWLPVARPDPGTNVDAIIRAFCDVFADCSLWNATPFDFMLVGTRNLRGPASLQRFRQPWVTPHLEASLREAGFEHPEQIGATFLGDAAYLRHLTASTPSVTDDFPQRLRPVPRRPSLSDPGLGTDPVAAAIFDAVLDPSRARTAFEMSPFIQMLWPEELRAPTLSQFGVQRAINQVIWDGAHPLARIETLHAVLTGTRLETLPLWLLGSDERRQRIAAADGDDGSGIVDYARGLRALSRREYDTAARALARAAAQGLSHRTLRPLQAYAHAMAGDDIAAAALVRDLQPDGADLRHFREWMTGAFRLAAGAAPE